MSETLLIHYNINAADQASWALCNEHGELTGKISQGSLEALKAAAENEAFAARPVVVLLNSYCLHINQLQLPTQNMQKMLKAVPYALEEYIAGDVEDFHFVIARNRQDNTTSVVGIEAATLERIIRVFQDLGLFVERILPDALCLPVDEGKDKLQWAALDYHQDCYLQTASLSGMLYTHDVFPYVLRQALQEHAPQKLLLFSRQDDSETFDELARTLSEEHENLEVLRVAYNEHPLVVFCGHYRQALPLNLLQHKYKARRKSSGYLQYWKLAAALAALAVLLHLGITAFEQQRLAEKNRLMHASIEKIYKKAFPESRKIVNPRVQMEQKLKALRGSRNSSNQGMLFLLSESFGSLDKLDAVSIQSIAYRNNRIDVSLDSKNLQAIENLNRRLNENPRIRAEIVSSTSEKDRVSGNIRIESRS